MKKNIIRLEDILVAYKIDKITLQEALALLAGEFKLSK